MATRIRRLAQPKPDRLGYPDRRSVYWLDRLPPERTGSTTRTGTGLHCVLHVHTFPSLLFCDPECCCCLCSPVWEVSEPALRAVASDRLSRLARPRTPAAAWQPERPLLAALNTGTQTVVATSRICQLARPRSRRPVLETSGPQPKVVTSTRIAYKASAHIELLATPKRDHPKFEGERRSACWSVSRAARRAAAGRRLLELSCPKERTALFQGYDPYAVSPAALAADPSARVRQLCLPLSRKCSAHYDGALHWS
ncbi:sperm microtubule associated protein 2 [Pseudoliparis swirei]|uniref:sperm microtubule associated protein 2 n=1 Tax=Pseudoliparis swirei TaxID=2059687 RepID=UPI0024BDF627|nr:sperm microtubule associated protein 2 [Pseudoliparis swirei]